MSAARSAPSPDAVDPAHDVVAVVQRLDPSIDRAQLVDLIVGLVPETKSRRALANKLHRRPGLLTGAGAYGTPMVIRLIDALLSHGVTGVVAPPCPLCHRAVPLSRGHEGLRCCKSCWDRIHAKPCAGCGTITQLARRTREGQSLCDACARTEPALLEPCDTCGRMRLPARRRDGLVICHACCTPPAATCSECGKRKPCHFVDTAAPLCKNCSANRRAQPCSRCGQQRVIHTRTSSGEPLCKACGSVRLCAGCGRERPIRARTEAGNLCQTCYKNDPLSHRECSRCGALGPLHRFGLCATCAWPDVIRNLLTSPSGEVRADLEPVRAALNTIDAKTGLNWVARARTQQMLSALATGSGPISHAVLDQLTPSAATAHLRTILVEQAVLAPRDEGLAGLEQAVKRRISRVHDPVDRKILQSHATWHHLRRLRATASRRLVTQDQVIYACNTLTAAAALLNWLHERSQQLATCTQDDIDEWLGIDTFSRSRGFVAWAVSRGHAKDIEIPPFNNTPVRQVFNDHDQRWTLARQLLHDDSTALEDRVAGLLVLLYAQRAARITQLTTDHITITDNGVELTLGQTPIAVPAAFADLLEAFVNDRRASNASRPEKNTWLYPAARLGQPLAPRTLLQRLRAIGIQPTLGRNTALMQMAAEMPPPVLNKLLGISLDRATRWTQEAGNSRPGYAAAVAQRNR